MINKENQDLVLDFGLSIVKNILEKHNFEYGVDSKKGVGTTFYFKI
jgi:signal transduction histidine kinase